ncbi:hypothetical protein ANTPLA_LOCUS10457 [Anthophora plagiata]
MVVKRFTAGLVLIDGPPRFVDVVTVVSPVIKETWPVGVTKRFVERGFVWLGWIVGETKDIVSSARITIHGERMRVISSYDHQRFLQLDLLQSSQYCFFQLGYFSQR